jgi:carboxymethylenebutenolidase
VKTVGNDSTLRSQYGCAAGPIVKSTIVRTSSEGLAVTETAIERAGAQMPIYAARPEGKTDLPVVLVICEAFGLNEHLRDIARRFAHAGYLAIAPDLMVRQGDPLKFDDFEILRRDLLLKIPDEQVMRDLDACVEWARGFGGDRERITATGFCWGGRWLWLYAAQRPFVAAVSWYGLLDAESSGVLPTDSPLFPVHPIDLAEKIQTPVLGLYGGRDPAIPLVTIEAMKRRLTRGSEAAQDSQILAYHRRAMPSSPIIAARMNRSLQEMAGSVVSSGSAARLKGVVMFLTRAELVARVTKAGELEISGGGARRNLLSGPREVA